VIATRFHKLDDMENKQLLHSAVEQIFICISHTCLRLPSFVFVVQLGRNCFLVIFFVGKLIVFAFLGLTCFSSPSSLLTYFFLNLHSVHVPIFLIFMFY
jgi:hypothetical protein